MDDLGFFFVAVLLVLLTFTALFLTASADCRSRIFDASQKAKIEELTLDYEKLSAARVDAVMDLFVKQI